MGYEIQFDVERCGGGGECIAACNRGVWEWKEIEFEFFDRKIRKRLPYPVKPEYCVGCRKCEIVCPTGCLRVVRTGV